MKKKLTFIIITTLLLTGLPILAQAAWHFQAGEASYDYHPGDSFTVEVKLSGSGMDIDAFGFNFNFPSALLQFDGTDFTGTLLESWPVKDANEYSPGILKVAGLNFAGKISSPAEGIWIKLNFTVKTDASGSGEFSITDFGDDLLTDGSTSTPAPINVITSNPSITVTAPNGGESWVVGSTENITWSSQDFTDNVKIEYSTDNGASRVVVASTPNTGFYSWVIPNTPSANCLVKVSDAADGDPSDVSDAVFAIGQTSITPLVESPQIAGSEFWVEIQVGSEAFPITGLFGVTFTLNYAHTDYLDIATPQSATVIPGDFLGTNVVFVPYVDDPAGRVTIGVTKKLGAQAANGIGIAAKVKFISLLNTPDSTVVDLTISNIIAVDKNGKTLALEPQAASVVINNGGNTTVEPSGSNANDVPTSFQLFQNYPNPFNPKTAIEYRVKTAGRVVLKVFDTLGKEVATIVDSPQDAGVYHVQFDAKVRRTSLFLK